MSLTDQEVKLKKLGLLAILLLATNPAWTQGDPARGKGKIVVCTACHGADGRATLSMYPHLAGQNYEYLVNAMKAYKGGQRRGNTAAFMTAPMAALSEQDMQDLAAYYASLGK
ncbi:MAG: c-type cytochrome [Burkholderiales bacterium]